MKKFSPKNLTLMVFCAILIFSIILDIPVLLALLAGLVLFIVFAVKQGFSLKDVLKMMAESCKTGGNVVLTLAFSGMLTGIWRASGTIAVIICWAAKLIKPEIFLLISFLLNSAMSFLTGTSFGTAATMGTICMGIGNAMGISPVLSGASVMSGIFFGDRGSPVSSSAILVADITSTDLYENVRDMMKTAVLPAAVTAAAYTAMGFVSHAEPVDTDIEAIFSGEFDLSILCIIPAAIIIILALLKVKVKKAMACSIAAAILISCLVQHISVLTVPLILLRGFRASDPQIAEMLNGGGLFSMAKTLSIVMLSCSYAGIFDKTEMLTDIRSVIGRLSEKITPFGGLLAASFFSAMISCNQTLGTMLTCELCRKTIPDSRELAIGLENSIILVAALVPWSICGAVPLATIGAPTSALLPSFYIWLVPLFHLMREILRRRRSRGIQE